MSSVDATWIALAAERRLEPGWHLRRLHPEAVVDIYAALEQPGSIPALLFEVPARAIPAGVQHPACAGFNLAPETIAPGPSGQVRLCLRLRDSHYRDVFAVLAGDVAAATAATRTPEASVRALYGRLNTWQRFVTTFGPDVLSEQAQLGLYAELRVLEKVVLPTHAAGQAVRAWVGPERAPQDFVLEPVRLEVKASCAAPPSAVKISSLDQLEPGGALLFLGHLTAVADHPDGDRLPTIIARLRRRIGAEDAGAAALFDDRLMLAGYLDVHASRYQRTYGRENWRWHEVRAGFPALTHATVPAAVEDAAYSISLPACAPFEVAEEHITRIITRGIHE